MKMSGVQNGICDKCFKTLYSKQWCVTSGKHKGTYHQKCALELDADVSDYIDTFNPNLLPKKKTGRFRVLDVQIGSLSDVK